MVPRDGIKPPTLGFSAILARVRQIESAFDILPLDFSITETFGMLKASLESQGAPLDDFDLALAASALALNLTLVANNEKHFRRLEGLRLQNWTCPPPS